MRTDGLTKKQIAVLRTIAEYQRREGISPTLAEIQALTGFSNKSVVHVVLCGLRDRGRIKWVHGCARSIMILPDVGPGHILPPALQDKLARYCAGAHEDPAGVVADAVALHLDFIEAQSGKYREPAGAPA